MCTLESELTGMVRLSKIYIKVKHNMDNIISCTIIVTLLIGVLGFSHAWAACASPGAFQIVVYQHSNYGGECRVISMGAYPSAGSFGFANDSISSLRVGASVRAVLFQHTNYGGEQALYEPGQYPSLGTGVNEQTSSIRITPTNGHRVAFRYVGNNPYSYGGRWADEAQGLAHDTSSWFITRKSDIYKYAMGADLAKDSPLARTGMPWQLAQWGCDHFGDPDHKNGYLFVPVEGCRDKYGEQTRYLAAFRTVDLRLVCYDELYDHQQNKAGWVAIHPKSGLLYTSGGELNGSSPLITYRIDWSALYFDNEPHWFLYGGSVRQYLLRQNYTSVDLAGIQGGAFSDDGHLFYLTNGSYTCNDSGADKGGLRVFDADSGVLIAKAGNKYGYFNYEFHCGGADGQEPEGLDYVNLDGKAGPYSGQLHVLMLDNDYPSDDEIYIKHYTLY